MFDRQINAGCVVSWAMWVLSIALAIVASIYDSMDVGRFSLIACGGAVTVTLKHFLTAHARQIKTALIVTGRAEDRVRHLR